MDDPPELLELFKEEFMDVTIPGLVAPGKKTRNIIKSKNYEEMVRSLKLSLEELICKSLHVVR